MVAQRLETAQGSPTYEAIPNVSLRHRMGRIEEEIQRHEWPMRSNFVSRIFSPVFGFYGDDVSRIIEAVRKRGVIDLIRRESKEGFPFYVFNEDHVRALGVLCWVIGTEPLRRGRVAISLDYDVQKAKEALGNDPLRDLIHDPLPNKPKKNTNTTEKDKPVIKLPLFSHNGGVEDGEPKDEKSRDPEEVLIEGIKTRIKESPVSGKIPSLEGEELRRAFFWTKDRLKALYGVISDDVINQVSYSRIPSLRDDSGMPHFFHHPEARMVMFISAVVAPNSGEMAGFNPSLEELTYRQLRLGLDSCNSAFEGLERKGLHVKNLTELFSKAIKALERRNATKPNVLAGNTAGPDHEFAQELPEQLLPGFSLEQRDIKEYELLYIVEMLRTRPVEYRRLVAEMIMDALRKKHAGNEVALWDITNCLEPSCSKILGLKPLQPDESQDQVIFLFAEAVKTLAHE